MNIVLLNNIDHGDIRVKPGRGAEYGDCVNQVVIAPTEFGDIHKEFPIVFRKDEDGHWQSVALLGFANGENLFLEGTAWSSNYIPAMLARGAFSIGINREGDAGGDAMINIDLDYPGVGAPNGQRLFLPQGGNAPFLEHVTRILRTLYSGLEVRQHFFDSLERHNLIEPVEITADASAELKFVVKGFSTVSQDRLAALDGASLQELNRSGVLYDAHLVLSSLTNLPRLIEMKRHAHEAGRST